MEPLDSKCIAATSTVATPQPMQVTKGKKSLIYEMAQQCNSEVSADNREIFFHFFLSYADVFATPQDCLGRTTKLKHNIDTGFSSPIRQAVRCIPPHRKEEVSALLEDMLKKDIIQPSCSPWASPVVLVQKKDDTTRFCVDYRKLNKVTRKDAYPLPRIDDTLDTLHGSQWFSTLDLASGYWQVELEKEAQQRTTFCTPNGLFEFNVMPFGLCNAPATFQRLMDLHRLTECKTHFKWTTECQQAFETLQSKLTTPPILVYPNFSKEFVLDTNASDSGIGAVLSQLGMMEKNM